MLTYSELYDLRSSILCVFRRQTLSIRQSLIRQVLNARPLAGKTRRGMGSTIFCLSEVDRQLVGECREEQSLLRILPNKIWHLDPQRRVHYFDAKDCRKIAVPRGTVYLDICQNSTKFAQILQGSQQNNELSAGHTLPQNLKTCMLLVKLCMRIGGSAYGTVSLKLQWNSPALKCRAGRRRRRRRPVLIFVACQ